MPVTPIQKYVNGLSKYSSAFQLRKVSIRIEMLEGELDVAQAKGDRASIESDLDRLFRLGKFKDSLVFRLRRTHTLH